MTKQRQGTINFSSKKKKYQPKIGKNKREGKKENHIWEKLFLNKNKKNKIT